MRISDWSSDVCSSDLLLHLLRLERAGLVAQRLQLGVIVADLAHILSLAPMIGSRSVARSQAQASGSEQKCGQVNHANGRECKCALIRRCRTALRQAVSGLLWRSHLSRPRSSATTQERVPF